MPPSLRLTFAVLILAAPTPAARAQVVYTFELPQFSFMQLTPFIDIPPNIGSAAFRASFTASPNPNGLGVNLGSPIPGIVGQSLFDPALSVDTLTVTLNTPVNQLSVNFVLQQPGFLHLSTPAGSVDQPATIFNGPYSGGLLAFASPTPFSTFSIVGMTTGGVPALYGIDNLALTPVPEPRSWLLVLGAALPAAAGWRRRAAAPKS